jgi:hypothetical protein
MISRTNILGRVDIYAHGLRYLAYKCQHGLAFTEKAAHGAERERYPSPPQPNPDLFHVGGMQPYAIALTVEKYSDMPRLPDMRLRHQHLAAGLLHPVQILA